MSKRKENEQYNIDKNKHKRDENREIGFITYIFIGIFVALICYVCYFTQFVSRDFINNPFNKRQQLLEERLVRGEILSKDGDVLARTTEDENGNYVREYPYKNVFAHVVGYSTHGVLGIERLENFKLLECNDNIVNKIENDLSGERNIGNKVTSTLDVKVQQAAYDALGNNKGAVVVMNAYTGEILAMVSKPDFDPNTIMTTWDDYNADEVNSPLLNRAVLGLYPPGSTFKIVTALEYISEEGNNINNYDFECNGSFTSGDTTINCYHGQRHGAVDFDLSFAKSCNSSFANMTSTLDKGSFESLCNDLLFGKNLPGPFAASRSITSISADSPMDELLQTGIGQGKTLVTPMHMTLITAAIANGGRLMNPYIVSKIEGNNGRIIESNKPKEYGRLIDLDKASILYKMMRDVVTDGTASRALDTKGYTIGGKTGSAEYQSDKTRSHAWFTGYGVSDNSCIVTTVIVEDGGSGGEVAVPIAKRVFDAYYDR